MSTLFKEGSKNLFIQYEFINKTKILTILPGKPVKDGTNKIFAKISGLNYIYKREGFLGQEPQDLNIRIEKLQEGIKLLHHIYILH